MRIQVTKPLFAWDCLEDSPSLNTVRQFLQAIPDGTLLEGLRSQRGRGRNDYPVHVLWGVVLLTHLLRHTSTKAGDGETLPSLLRQAQNDLPDKRIETLAYDKAADDNHVHRLLSKARIKPLIHNRSLWKEEHEKMLPGHNGRSNVVYDEAGTLHWVMVVHAGLALLLAATPRRHGTLGKTRLSAIQRALQEPAAA